MKKNIILICLINIVITAPFQAATKKKATTAVNIRTEPSTESEIIDVLYEGEVIKVLKENKTEDLKWDKVKFKDTVGYIYNMYLEKTNDDITDFDERENIILQKIISLEDFRYKGIVDWNGWKWTYYLMSQFPGSTSTPVNGRYVNNQGFVCDSDGYIILASVDLSPYTIVDTPFGYKGKVYDTGCPSGILDVYTNW